MGAIGIDWHRLAESIAHAWAAELPRVAALDSARNALQPLSCGGPAQGLPDHVRAAITQRRDVLRDPAFASLTDAAVSALALRAVRVYESHAREAAIASSDAHMLLGVECKRVADSVWCGRAGRWAIYAVRESPAVWRVSIGDASVADYDERHALAVGTGPSPYVAALHAAGRAPEDARGALLERMRVHAHG
jgi:hypothetical protein